MDRSSLGSIRVVLYQRDMNLYLFFCNFVRRERWNVSLAFIYLADVYVRTWLYGTESNTRLLRLCTNLHPTNCQLVPAMCVVLYMGCLNGYFDGFFICFWEFHAQQRTLVSWRANNDRCDFVRDWERKRWLAHLNHWNDKDTNIHQFIWKNYEKRFRAETCFASF